MAGSASGQALIAIPSIDLGPRYAARTDVASFEQRWLYVLLHLRDPAARVAVVTSVAPPSEEVGHWLELAGVPSPGDRLALFHTGDDSSVPLAAKLLERPELLARVRAFAGPGARIVPFGVGPAEEEVARALEASIDGVAARHAVLESKSASRRLLRAAGVPVPRGAESLRGETDVAVALRRVLAARGPRPDAAVVKLDRGVAGDGNAILERGQDVGELPDAIRAGLGGGAIVEELVRSPALRSPSGQARLHPGGDVELLSTHDQVLGGPLGQTYMACTQPADAAYAADVERLTRQAGEELAARGVVGRIAVDYVAAPPEEGSRWRLWGVEINLREGATTHPWETKRLLGVGGAYYATDALIDPAWKVVTPARLLAAATAAGLLYDPATGEGIVPFMLRALPVEGRIGLVAFAADRDEARGFADRLRGLLDDLSASGG